MPENYGIGHLHHGGFHVKGKENTLLLGVGHLFAEKSHQGFLAHEGGVEDFSGLQGNGFLQRGLGSVGRGEDDPSLGRGVQGDRLLVGAKITGRHRGDVSLGVSRPFSHGVGVGLGEILHRSGSAAVGVAFAKDRVDGGPLDLGIAVFRILVIRDVVTGAL